MIGILRMLNSFPVQVSYKMSPLNFSSHVHKAIIHAGKHTITENLWNNVFYVCLLEMYKCMILFMLLLLTIHLVQFGQQALVPPETVWTAGSCSSSSTAPWAHSRQTEGADLLRALHYKLDLSNSSACGPAVKNSKLREDEEEAEDKGEHEEDLHLCLSAADCTVISGVVQLSDRLTDLNLELYHVKDAELEELFTESPNVIFIEYLKHKISLQWSHSTTTSYQSSNRFSFRATHRSIQGQCPAQGQVERSPTRPKNVNLNPPRSPHSSPIADPQPSKIPPTVPQ